MSYRSFKHLLGETSLERKCRFMFGAGILVLVTISFFLYGQKNESLVVGQSTVMARMLVRPEVMNLHHKSFGDPRFSPVMDEISDHLSPLDDMPRYEARILNPYKVKYPESYPSAPKQTVLDKFEKDAPTLSEPTLRRPPCAVG